MQVYQGFAIALAICQSVFYLAATIMVIAVGLGFLRVLDRIDRERERHE